ncbi:SMC-Scp complex subunit ScpB [Candidatus Giovannonibacteria bacterium]|nr:SMC-Scp complex subunit ScpB [Candidatus Giovannonibacteria bacterium]
MSDLEKKLEAILFVAGEPLHLEKLSKILKKEESEIKEALGKLSENLRGTGLTLLENEERYTLATSPELSEDITAYMKSELGEELSRAALETLAVIVYKGPISRTSIDYIRGVNSSFTVRNLMIRGIIERKPDPKDSRSWLYFPSFDFMKFMGIEKLENLKGYPEFRKEMDVLLEKEKKEEL